MLTTLLDEQPSRAVVTWVEVGLPTAAPAGAATGLGAVSGVGASTAEAVGAASGTGVATGIGAATAASVGAASGVGAAAGVGASTAASTGAASGTGVETGVGASTAASTGAASGTGTVAGVGASTAASVGAAAGTGDAPGIGASTAASVGAASGAGAAAAVGTGINQAVGAASGTGVATGVGISTAASVGAASGTGVATGIGASTAASVGSAAGTGAAAGTATSTAAAVGSAFGGAGTGALPAFSTAGTVDQSTQLAGTFSINIPSHNAGDLLLLCSQSNNLDGDGLLSAINTAGWTWLDGTGHNYGVTEGTKARLAIAWKLGDGSETTVSVTHTGGTNTDRHCDIVHRFTAANGYAATPIQNISTAFGLASATIVCPTVVPSGIRERGICIVGSTFNGPISGPSDEVGGNWLEFSGENRGTGGMQGYLFADLSAGTTISGGSIATGSGDWIAVGFTIVPVALTGAATGVGASTAAAVGSASGTGTATGIGGSTAAAVGSASGTGVATGISDTAGAGAASGAGTATGIGGSTAAAVGSASGIGSADGVGDSTFVAAAASGADSAVPAGGEGRRKVRRRRKAGQFGGEIPFGGQGDPLEDLPLVAERAAQPEVTQPGERAFKGEPLVLPTATILPFVGDQIAIARAQAIRLTALAEEAAQRATEATGKRRKAAIAKVAAARQAAEEARIEAARLVQEDEELALILLIA